MENAVAKFSQLCCTKCSSPL